MSDNEKIYAVIAKLEMRIENLDSGIDDIGEAIKKLELQKQHTVEQIDSDIAIFNEESRKLLYAKRLFSDHLDEIKQLLVKTEKL